MVKPFSLATKNIIVYFPMFLRSCGSDRIQTDRIGPDRTGPVLSNEKITSPNCFSPNQFKTKDRPSVIWFLDRSALTNRSSPQNQSRPIRRSQISGPICPNKLILTKKPGFKPIYHNGPIHSNNWSAPSRLICYWWTGLHELDCEMESNLNATNNIKKDQKRSDQ